MNLQDLKAAVRARDSGKVFLTVYDGKGADPLYEMARRVADMFEDCPYCGGTNKIWDGPSSNPPIVKPCGYCFNGAVYGGRLKEITRSDSYAHRGGLSPREVWELLFGEDT